MGSSQSHMSRASVSGSDPSNEGGASESKSPAHFDLLPVEIRLQVWQATIEPRIVGIVPFEVSRGRWSLKSTARPPAAMHVNREARDTVARHYAVLDVAAKWYQNWEDIDHLADFPVFDVAPVILFNFGLDTLHFVDTDLLDKPLQNTVNVIGMKKPTVPTNVMDILILREGPNVFGPSMARWYNCSARMLEWYYIMLGQRTMELESIHHGIPTLGNSTAVRYLRLDFGIFLSDLALYWRHLHPFERWLSQAARRISEPASSLRSCELVMTYGTRTKQNLKRLFRLALRPESGQDSTAGYTSQTAHAHLLEDGAIVFERALPDSSAKVALFEVVEPHIDHQALAKWQQLSEHILSDISDDINVYLQQEELAASFGAFLWAASKKRGFAHGEMAPVHGLCLPDYGVDGGFRGSRP